MKVIKKNKNINHIFSIIIILLLISEVYGQGFKFTGISSGKNKGKNKESNKDKKPIIAHYNETNTDDNPETDELYDEFGEHINDVNILSNYNEDEKEVEEIKSSSNNNKSKEPSLNFKTDMGQCICDLTRNKCDINCCCDPDCTSEMKYFFTGECLPEGPEDKDKPMCSKLLKKVHNPNVIVTDDYDGSGSAVLCIVMDHNPDMGYFYENPGRIEDKTTFISQFKRLQSTFSYSDKSLSLILPQKSYTLGSPIIIANKTQSTYSKRSDNKKEIVLQSYAFTIPKNTESGFCDTFSPILFLMDIETKCTRRYSKTKKEFTIDYYKTNEILFIRNPTTSNYTTPNFKEMKVNMPEITETHDEIINDYSSDYFNEHEQDYFDPFHQNFNDYDDPLNPNNGNNNNIDNDNDYLNNGYNNDNNNNNSFNPNNGNNNNNDPFNQDNGNNNDDPFNQDNGNNNNDPFNQDNDNNNDDNNDNNGQSNPDNNNNDSFYPDNDYYDPNHSNDNDNDNNNNNNGINNDEDYFIGGIVNGDDDYMNNPFNHDNGDDDDDNNNNNDDPGIADIDNDNNDDDMNDDDMNDYFNYNNYNIFNEPDKEFNDDNDNFIPYVHNFNDNDNNENDNIMNNDDNESSNIINNNDNDNDNENDNIINNNDNENDNIFYNNDNLNDNTFDNNDNENDNIFDNDENNIGIKFNMNSDLKDEEGEGEEDEDKASIINLSVDKSNNDDDDINNKKKEFKTSKIHGIKINKNNIFKREEKYVYNNGKYYIRKNEEDDKELHQALLQSLSNNNNNYNKKNIKKRVIEQRINVNNLPKSTSKKDDNNLQKVVLQVNYKIYYSTPNRGSAANADIIDSVDVEILYDELNLNDNELITQTFNVQFLKSIIKQAETDPEIDINKVTPRKTSGNPGYIFGKEILTSTLNNGTLEETEGFTIPKNILINGELRCPYSTSKSNRGRIPVTFGDDIVSECTLPIDPSINSDYAEITKKMLEIHHSTLRNITYIARFGNSTVNNSWEWIKMIQPESVSNLASCDTLPTELALQFIWAYVGSLKNPQPMIIGARATYGTAGNICTCTVGNTNENDCDINRKKLSYNLRTTVSFLLLPDHGTELYMPRAPRLIPAVQEDLFYPFFIRNEGSHRISFLSSSKIWILSIIIIFITYSLY